MSTEALASQNPVHLLVNDKIRPYLERLNPAYLPYQEAVAGIAIETAKAGFIQEAGYYLGFIRWDEQRAHALIGIGDTVTPQNSNLLKPDDYFNAAYDTAINGKMQDESRIKILLKLARVKYSRGRRTKKIMDKALEITTGIPESRKKFAYRDVAPTLVMLDRVDEALDLARSLEDEPFAVSILTEVAATVGKRDESGAKSILQEAERKTNLLKTTHSKNTFNIALADVAIGYAQIGSYRYAEQIASDISANNGDVEHIYAEIGLHQARNGQKLQATDSFSRAHSHAVRQAAPNRNPYEWPMYLENIALAEAKAGQFYAALATLSRTTKRHSWYQRIKVAKIELASTYYLPATLEILEASGVLNEDEVQSALSIATARIQYQLQMMSSQRYLFISI
ncbi:hypothetical protein C4579_00290 [Candidatus Microgenomates bacterium]|nr:MAG: hypothetical protein C4579_00290 [Candidatus Microgenomates bacterium]